MPPTLFVNDFGCFVAIAVARVGRVVSSSRPQLSRLHARSYLHLAVPQTHWQFPLSFG